MFFLANFKGGKRMIVYEVKTKKTKEALMDKAVSFFGPDGLGLEVTSREACCLSFSGGGGFVNMSLSEEENNKEITVELESREWDYQVKKFTQLI